MGEEGPCDPPLRTQPVRRASSASAARAACSKAVRTLTPAARAEMAAAACTMSAGRPRSAEFAFYGPPAFDVGSLFANLIFAALRHANRPAQAAILALLNECWSTYVAALAPSGDAAEGDALAAPQAVRRLLQPLSCYPRLQRHMRK